MDGTDFCPEWVEADLSMQAMAGHYSIDYFRPGDRERNHQA